MYRSKTYPFAARHVMRSSFLCSYVFFDCKHSENSSESVKPAQQNITCIPKRTRRLTNVLIHSSDNYYRRYGALELLLPHEYASTSSHRQHIKPRQHHHYLPIITFVCCNMLQFHNRITTFSLQPINTCTLKPALRALGQANELTILCASDPVKMRTLRRRSRPFSKHVFERRFPDGSGTLHRRP